MICIFRSSQEVCQLLTWWASSLMPCTQWDAVPVVWWLCFSQGNESLTQLLLLHSWYWFLIFYPGMRSGHPGGPRFGSRLLFCFLPFMAIMDFLRFPPFPLLLYRWDHYVARGKWVSRQCLSLPPLCHLSVCRTRLVVQRFLIAVFVLATLCEPMAFQSHGKLGSYWACHLHFPICSKQLRETAGCFLQPLDGMSQHSLEGSITTTVISSPSTWLVARGTCRARGVELQMGAPPWYEASILVKASVPVPPTVCSQQGREWWRASLDRLVLAAGKCWLRAPLCSSQATGMLCPSLLRSTLRQELLFRWMPLKN